MFSRVDSRARFARRLPPVWWPTYFDYLCGEMRHYDEDDELIRHGPNQSEPFLKNNELWI